MKSFKKIGIALISASVLASSAAIAKSYQKSENFQVNANVNKIWTLQNIGDENFGTFDPGKKSGDVKEHFCFGTNVKDANAYYTLNLEGEHPKNNKYRMTLNGQNVGKDDTNKAMPFKVTLTDSQDDTKKLKNGQTADNGGNGFNTDEGVNCSSKHGHQVLTMSIQGDTSNKVPGSYKDTLTIEVSPL
jgi:spore coat protein U-like protein